ncbi:hypothetical protein Cgig2_024187 [Carnegiea gigantea]|uniref:Uncharacterized protein n=1 Tax=Carnegiea gigantea TaxID=171969 RepID=A0A9Q1KI80_9CARY|nr:hypothetical protein Cgig2_024187 [Carnegiea gigantea]
MPKGHVFLASPPTAAKRYAPAGQVPCQGAPSRGVSLGGAPARVVGQLAAYGMSSCLHTQLKYWTSSHNAQVHTTIGIGRCRTLPGLIGMPSTTIGAWCRRRTPLVIYSCPWDNPVVLSRNPPRQCPILRNPPLAKSNPTWTLTKGTGRCRTSPRLIGMPSTTIGAWCHRTTPLVIYSCPWDNPVVLSRNPPRQCPVHVHLTSGPNPSSLLKELKLWNRRELGDTDWRREIFMPFQVTLFIIHCAGSKKGMNWCSKSRLQFVERI